MLSLASSTAPVRVISDSSVIFGADMTTRPFAFAGGVGFCATIVGVPNFLSSVLFDIILKECPHINIIKQSSKKVKWWKGHPDALKDKDPRQQLQEWFKEEEKFQKRGGPQSVGEIMGEDDPDKIRFLAECLGLKKDGRCLNGE